MRKFCYALSFIFLISCGVPKHIKNDITIKYCENDSIINTRIKTNGFYSSVQYYNENLKNSLRTFHIFFSDGIFLTGYGGNTIEFFLDKINNDETIFNSYYTGLYTISGDTLVAQYVNCPSPPKVWLAYEERFLIINEDSIMHLSTEPLGNISSYSILSHAKLESSIMYEPAVYYKASVPLTYDVWLKRKKWFWKNEVDYKEWKKRKNKLL